ncbi:MAG: Uma2 family endonuclease [Anaerolineae bacterium]|nr:Uma2 family endonuclease [Anaerolineae bacterium]
MATSSVRITGMSIEDFVERFSAAPFELVDGEYIPMAPVLAGHGNRGANIFLSLGGYVQQNQLGKVFAETPYVIVYNSDWVTGSRVPDLMYFEAKRLTEYQDSVPDWEQKPFILVPDLCIEIVSKNDSYSEINDKVGRYLADGVRLIWVVDQATKSVTVHRPGHSQQMLKIGETLSDENLFGDFALPVADIFV